MESEKAHLKRLLIDTISLLCQNGLTYNQNLKIEGVIGITVDNAVFIVHIDETVDTPNDKEDDCLVDEDKQQQEIKADDADSTNNPNEISSDENSYQNGEKFHIDGFGLVTASNQVKMEMTDDLVKTENYECNNLKLKTKSQSRNSKIFSKINLKPFYTNNNHARKKIKKSNMLPTTVSDLEGGCWPDNTYNSNNIYYNNEDNYNNNNQNNGFDYNNPESYLENQSYQRDSYESNDGYSTSSLQQPNSEKMEGKLRPHRCQYPECHRTFIRKDHLVRHQRTFHGKQWGVDSQIIFFCSHCPRKFYKTFSLNRHLLDIHGIVQNS